MNKILLGLMMMASALSASAKEVVWFDGQNAVTYSVQNNTDLVVGTAIFLLTTIFI